MASAMLVDTLKRDLTAFADPASIVSIDERGASWTQGRRPMNATFLRAAGGDFFPTVRFADRDFKYTEFFASEHMADLRALAEMTLHGIKMSPFYVDAQARKDDADESEVASDLLNRLSSESLPYASTRVTFVRGEAGAGKTAFLRHLALSQAEKYILGESSFLYLYIDAQGRSLSRVDDLMARLLQDYRARFTYHAVSTLTRLGTIVPIIDGFDELLGVGGYSEAFQSLARFLARLNGLGAVIASARSTFYEFQEFGESAARYSDVGLLGFEIVAVDMQPWGGAEISQYLEKAGATTILGSASAGEAAQRLKDAVHNSNVLRTPFFVATIVELLKAGQDVLGEGRLLPKVVTLFAEREVLKLRDESGAPIANLSGHFLILRMLAEEMWWQQSRELDVGTVKTIAEMAAEQLGITPSAARRLSELITSYAFLEKREREGEKYLGFQHEYYYSFFLGGLLISLMDGPIDEFNRAISRAVLPDTVADEFSHQLVGGPDRASATITRIGGRPVLPLTREVNRENAGLLFAGLIRVRGLDLKNAVIANGDLVYQGLEGTQLEDCTFRQCEIVRADLRGAKWSNVRFENSAMYQTVVNSETRLGLVDVEVGKEIVGFIRLEGKGEERIFDPGQVTEIAKALHVGLKVVSEPGEILSERADRHMRAVRKFLRMASRLFHVSGEDIRNAGLHAYPEWGLVKDLLEKHGLLVSKHIQRKGPSGMVWTLAVPPAEIERGEGGASANSNVTSFWRELRGL